MKVSQYNSIYDFPSNPSQKLMFNAKSLALALVDCSKVEQYENYCQTHEEIPDEAFLNDLKTGGFLIDDSIDEKAILKYEQLCSRYSRSHLSLVIAATSNCNFRCVYCYERSVLRASTMSEATQEAIVKFVESEAPHLESFTVTWYGGEPLLALDIIESLSLKFIDICKKNDIAYGATIVTNGYLLNCAVVEKLNTLYVNQYAKTLNPSDFIASSSLSGGEARKICLLRSFLKDSDFLILDEPDASLDQESCLQLVKHLQQLKSKKTILLVSHNPIFVNCCDEIICL